MDHLPVQTDRPSLAQAVHPGALAPRRIEDTAGNPPTLGDWVEATLTAACLADRGRLIDVDLHDAACALPGDADASAQALLMLLSNACRFSAAGTRLRLTSRIQWADGSDHLVISVCDRGIGMTRAALQRAFDPIRDISEGAVATPQEQTAAPRDGGLRIARSLLESQGGWIELRSALGIGTEADAWLPIPVSADRQA